MLFQPETETTLMQESSMQLQDKVAVITGGGTGIGAATARLFAREGAQVCVFGRRADPLHETITAIHAAGGTAMAMTGSVTSPSDCHRLMEETAAAHGRIDILVNSAGVARLMPLTETTDELWDEIIDTNLKGTFFTVRAVLPVMIRQGAGVIVNVSSVLGQVGIPKGAAYGASKAGIEQLTRVIALEYASQGIRANTVAPGWVETPMTESIQAHPRLFESLRARHPAGRFGTPEEVAHAVLYLASDEARWVTGSVLTIDGGWTAQ